MRWKIAIALMLSWGCNGSNPVTQPTPPMGTAPSAYTVTGFVKDTAFRDLAGARVEVVEGSKAGATAVTDQQGRFFMPGPFSDTVTVRATREGYVAGTKVVTSRAGSMSESAYFWLESTTPTADIAGDYILTLTADTACSQLPDVARARRYTASVVRSPVNSPHEYSAQLSGANLLPSPLGSGVFLGVAGDFVRAELDFDGIGIAEEIAPSTYVSIVGSADAPATASTVSGTLGGWFEYCASPTPVNTSNGRLYRCPVSSIVCQSSNHRFSLVRQ